MNIHANQKQKIKIEFHKMLCLLIVFSVILYPCPAFAAAISEAPQASTIKVVNNAGMNDYVYITSGLSSGDVVRVYNAASAGKLLGSATASGTRTEATITISQLGSAAGSIYVSVTSKGMQESGRVRADYAAEPKSEMLSPDNILITNNVGKNDTVYISGLAAGDAVKVYNAATGGKLLGSANVSGSKTEATITISQLGSVDGSIYVSVTSKGMLESDRVRADYAGEPKTDAPGTANLFVENNAGTSDAVYISGLTAGDVVKVYNAATGGKLLGSASVSGSKTEAAVTIAQLGSAAGSVYVSIAGKGMQESDRVKVDYAAEPKSIAPTLENITIVNNSGVADTINVNSLSPGDTVKVYSTPIGGKVLGSATVSGTKTEADISIAQLGSIEGSVYISVASKGMQESDRIKTDYGAESKSDAPDVNYISVVNNSGASDSVKVSGLSSGDTVTVYDAAKGGKKLGSAAVTTYGDGVEISVAQLGTTAGSIYVSVTGKNRKESERTRVDYAAEPTSDMLNINNISIVNNAGASDTVTVSGLTAGDVIKVYDAVTAGKVLGTGTVAASGSDVTISISQLGTGAGVVYISLTGKNKREGNRAPVNYVAEVRTTDPGVNTIIVVNGIGASDTVTVTGLTAGDTVKVYDAATGGKTLGSATVSGTNTEATVSVSQLGTTAGSVYVSLASKGKQESTRIKADYSAEPKSGALGTDYISVINNAGTSDTVTVRDLSAGDMVKVYSAAVGGSLLGSATVANTSTEATVTISQLGTEAGSVYVSITKKSMLESERIKADYSNEYRTDAPQAGNIVIFNNAGSADTINVSGITAGDVVKIYDAVAGGSLLGSGTVATSKTDVTVSVEQLGSAAGSVYVTITGKNRIESSRTKADYTAEGKTVQAGDENIIITNNAGTSDIVKVTGLSSGDTVKVYDAAVGGNLLGTGTAETYSSEVDISITQLGVEAGSIYVSVIGKNRLESDRKKADYAAEAVSASPAGDNISIINNAGAADVVRVSGLVDGDTVNVYDSPKGGSLLGSGAVAANSSSVTISITQLGAAAGSSYISVKSKEKAESARAKADYAAEARTAAPAESAISVTNNAGASDIIQVYGLTAGDIVNIYDAAKGGNLLATGTVDTYGAGITVSVAQLGGTAGSVYVTVTGRNKQESDRTRADYAAEPVSNPPDAEYIDVVNNAGMSDSIRVTGLLEGDTVKIYDAANGGSLIASGEVPEYGSEADIRITQLGTSAGSLYISVTGKNKQESGRTKVEYAAEKKSPALGTEAVNIVNQAGAADTVKVTGISEGDVVKVYDAAKGGNLLGSETVAAYGSDVTVRISQLGSSAGKVHISVTRKGMLESDRTQMDYAAEPKSASSDVSSVIITNHAGIADTVKVTGISEGDVVNVYDSALGGTLLGSAATAAGSTEATVSISQLGPAAGSVYVSVVRTGKLESDRTQIYYSEEVKSDAPVASNITVVNRAGKSDTVQVTFLEENDTVKVYSAETAGNLLGTATVASSGTEAVVYINQLGTAAGNVYVSVTRRGKLESDRTKAYYTAEARTDAPLVNNITVTNNVVLSDTVKVTFLTVDDIVKVYDAETNGNLLGSATVPTGSTEAVVSINQLGTGAGNVYISVTGNGKLESARTKVGYTEELKSNAPAESNVIVTNNAGMADTIRVTFLSNNDQVKIYDAAEGGNLLATATVPANSSKMEVTVTLAQLGTEAGNIYISVTSTGKLESDRTKVYYTEELTTDAPAISNVTVTNNAGMADVVKVAFLNANDTVKVYDSASGGRLLGTATVPEDSTSLEVTIKISQLGTTAGAVYVSVTGYGKLESGRTKVYYTEEIKPYAPLPANITVVNNAGSSDTVKVSGLVANDTVKVYDSAEGGKLLGTAVVPNGAAEVTIRITQLGVSAGSIYVTVTGTGTLESDRTKADFAAEGQ